MCILQIGELSNGLSNEFREATKDQLPWGMIRGMRNWLTHSYAEADEKILWETACNDIPKVLAFCSDMPWEAAAWAISPPSPIPPMASAL